MSTASVPSPPQTPGRSTYHHPARSRPHPHSYYLRVGDSLSRRFAKLICSAFLSILLAAALLVFILFLILRPHRPRFHLESFSLSQQRDRVSFNVSIRNPNREIGIYYDSMSGSVYYKHDQIAAFDRLLLPFYQPPKNTKVVLGDAAANTNDATENEMAEDAAAAGRVGLRLELRSTVRFRVTLWDTHRHRMHVSCGLEVGGDGNLVSKFQDKRCPIYFL